MELITASPIIPLIFTDTITPTPFTTGTPPPTATIAQQPGSICAEIWGVSQPALLPEWLTTPADVSSLHTSIKYYMLAGSLISKGIVNASECPDAGLTGDGSANTCGMEKAYLQVIEWQNQFDLDIITAAIENEIPAQVMKRLFAQESQFWPQVMLSPRAYGIGSVTSQGVEPLFMWFESVYQNTCMNYYSQPCALPYSSLTYSEQQELRGFFISRNIHAYCETCTYGIDLEKTRSSIDLFAKLIAANCSQVDLILTNHGFSTQEIPYEDLWRLTLANYTVGAGCVINGVTTMNLSSGFSWDSFLNTLDSGCYVDIYLNNITR